MVTRQVKSAIDKLLKAGLKRNQFSVRVERRYIGRYRGKAEYEYGNAQISLKNTSEHLLPFAEAMAKAGLHVEIWIFDNFKSLYVTDEWNAAGLWECDYTRQDEYGLPERKRING